MAGGAKTLFKVPESGAPASRGVSVLQYQAGIGVMRLYANAARSRFFLLPNAGSLARGALKVTAMTGEVFSVCGAARARFEVPEAVAKAFAEHAAAGMGR